MISKSFLSLGLLVPGFVFYELESQQHIGRI